MPSFSKNVSVHVDPEEFVSKIFSIGDIFTTEDGALRKLLAYYKKENAIYKNLLAVTDYENPPEYKPDLKEWHTECAKHSEEAMKAIVRALDLLEMAAYPAMTKYHRTRGFTAPLEWEQKAESTEASKNEDQFLCSDCGDVTKSTDYHHKDHGLYLSLKEGGRCEKCARGGE